MGGSYTPHQEDLDVPDATPGAGEHVITAADPLADDVDQILEAIKTRAAAH